MTIILFLAITTPLFLTSEAAATAKATEVKNVILDSSFEQYNSTQFWINHYEVIPTGRVGSTPWYSSSDNYNIAIADIVDHPHHFIMTPDNGDTWGTIIKNPDGSNVTAPQGKNVLFLQNLNDFKNTPGHPTFIYQDLSGLIKGKKYYLTWSQARRSGWGNSDQTPPSKFTVTICGVKVYENTNILGTFKQYFTIGQSKNFIASSSKCRLKFTVSSNDGWDRSILMDYVRLFMWN